MQESKLPNIPGYRECNPLHICGATERVIHEILLQPSAKR